MDKKLNKNIVLIFWASLFVGICLQICSCKNKSNSSNNNLAVTDSEVSDVKSLPEKDIDSPVTFKEERVYSSTNGTIQDGFITAYDNYVWAKSSTYNSDGYLSHFSYKSGSSTEDIKYKYDFSEETYSYVYSGSQKYVYGKDGNLLKQFSNDNLLYLYKYNSNGQETSKIEYNEGNSGEPRGVVRRGRSALGAGIHPKPGAFLAPVQRARTGRGRGRERPTARAHQVPFDLHEQSGRVFHDPRRQSVRYGGGR